MKIFGIYILSQEKSIILKAINNDYQKQLKFFSSNEDEEFIKSYTLSTAIKYKMHLPYKHKSKFYYGINDDRGIYILISDVENNLLANRALEQIQQIYNLNDMKLCKEKMMSFVKNKKEIGESVPFFENIKNQLSNLIPSFRK